jgi:serine/threonine-protein kinase
VSLERLRASLADRYRIERELGQGGMATVYLAEDLKHHRKVAVKVLKPELAQALGPERFLREIEIAAGLTHPHILPVHDSGEAAGFLYYVMPYVAGESLRERLAREGALPIPETARLLREVVDAVAKAHRAGIVHRDIKPENILLADGHALVTDFGIAKAVSAAAERTALTTAGMAVGTPAYMAPEQAAADPQVDHRADLYAMGIVGYEMLTGRPPFTGTTAQQVLAAQLTTPAEPVTKYRATIPAPLAELVMRCLAKHPADRPRSAEALLPVLDAAATSGAVAAVSVTTRRAPGRGILWLSATVMVAVLAVSVVVRRARPSARAEPASIAVLPFVDLGGDSTGQYFGDGVSEEILNSLTPLPGLTVIGRTSSFRFRGSDVDARDVGRQLGVGSLLSGSVQRAGGTIRVTAELVDTRSGRQLWSQKYDREVKNLFALEDEISRAIVQALSVTLTGGATRVLVREGTASPEAHDLYLQASALSRRSDEASLNQAAQIYRRALALDSTYAEAWAGLAGAYFWLGDAYRAPREMLPLAKQAALRAIALDDSLAVGHLQVGQIHRGWEWDYPAARRELERALALDPGLPEAHAAYGALLEGSDLLTAQAQQDTAAALDPFNPWFPWMGAQDALARGADTVALRLAERVRSIDPGFLYFFDLRAAVYLFRGQWAQCVRAYDDIPAELRNLPQFGLAICYAHLGDTTRARQILGRLEAKAHLQYVDGTTIGTIYAALGDKDRAFAWFERAYRDHSARLTWGTAAPPEFAPLLSDPRFVDLRARVGRSGAGRS